MKPFEPNIQTLSLARDVLLMPFGLDESKLIKVLGTGELKSAVTVHGHKFSKSAAEKITKAGGKVTVIGGEVKAPAEKATK